MTIYALPVAAVSSILNRVTGMALSVGIFGIAGASLIGMDVVPIVNSIGNSYVGPVAKLAVAFPLVYHYLAGVRHLMWDKSPPLLETKLVTQSSYILLGASGAITLGLAFVKI